ncbi:zinc-binding dehydrogenase [Brevibacillus antibioticus]|uniref:zinc-binding dehydrogenase n=1 Tax=Brevibacillus antibioticus TaxID=2570228 RepID=UPI001FCBD614|nr:zinc-binding dehydrogenase [Brevibacillus antibioticus]
MAIQLAKALGAYVATTTSSKNSDFVRELGADEVIVYDQGPLHTSTKFSFMLDTLGGEAYGDALKLMKRQGRVATIISERDAKKLSFADAVENERELVVTFVFTRPDGVNLNHIRALVEAKNVKPILTKVYPLTLEGVRDAHLFSQTGRVRGKIVLVHS